MSGEQNIGLYGKYTIHRNDGTDAPGQKHEHCRYFVLDLNHDPSAKPAILAYAKACEKTHPVLAQDLREQAKHFGFKGGRGPITMRCIGPSGRDRLARCKRIYHGQKGRDFISVRPFQGWVCPPCRLHFQQVFIGTGRDKQVIQRSGR
jgi:hypothetical protein